MSEAFPSAEISLRKVSLVSAIGRNLGDATILAQAMRVLFDAGIQPLGVHDLLRKVDLQVIVEPDDFEATIAALHKGLIEDLAPAPRERLNAAA